MDSESWTTKCAKSLRSATFFEPFLIVDISFETHPSELKPLNSNIQIIVISLPDNDVVWWRRKLDI